MQITTSAMDIPETVLPILNQSIGVILAGGEGRRMGGQDKGLILLHQKPLIEYPLAILQELKLPVLISANRHQDQYLRYTYPVINDLRDKFNGPLGGIEAALHWIEQHAPNTQFVVFTPCDLPNLSVSIFIQLLQALSDHPEAGIAIAATNQRIHPGTCALRLPLNISPTQHLDQEQRKLQHWQQANRCITVNFPEQESWFANCNTPESLSLHEHSLT